jgi:hypothetical protein
MGEGRWLLIAKSQKDKTANAVFSVMDAALVRRAAARRPAGARQLPEKDVPRQGGARRTVRSSKENRYEAEPQIGMCFSYCWFFHLVYKQYIASLLKHQVVCRNIFLEGGFFWETPENEEWGEVADGKTEGRYGAMRRMGGSR